MNLDDMTIYNVVEAWTCAAAEFYGPLFNSFEHSVTMRDGIPLHKVVVHVKYPKTSGGLRHFGEDPNFFKAYNIAVNKIDDILAREGLLPTDKTV